MPEGGIISNRIIFIRRNRKKVDVGFIALDDLDFSAGPPFIKSEIVSKYHLLAALCQHPFLQANADKIFIKTKPSN